METLAESSIIKVERKDSFLNSMSIHESPQSVTSINYEIGFIKDEQLFEEDITFNKDDIKFEEDEIKLEQDSDYSMNLSELQAVEQIYQEANTPISKRDGEKNAPKYQAAFLKFVQTNTQNPNDKNFSNRLQGHKKDHCPQDINMVPKNIIKEFYRVKCKMCDFETPHISRMKNHIHQHHEEPKGHKGPPIYKCEQCDHATFYKHNIKRHVLYHHTPKKECKQQPKVSNELELKCKLCCYETPHMGRLRIHFLRHHIYKKEPKKPKMFKCKDCDYVSNRKQNLQMHCRRHDTKRLKESKKEKILQCPECEYKTVIADYFGIHILTHKKEKELTSVTNPNNTEENEYELANSLLNVVSANNAEEKDDDSLSSLYEINANNAAEKEEKKKMLECRFCKYKTHQIGHLRFHIISHKARKDTQLRSNQEEILECSECDYKTVRADYFEIHILTHKKEKELANVTYTNIAEETECMLANNFLNNVEEKYDDLTKSPHVVDANIEEKEEDGKILQCPFCKYKTHQIGHLRLHISRHKAKKEKELANRLNPPKENEILTCEICPFQSRSKASMYMHACKHKEDPDVNPYALFQEPYKCKTCDFHTMYRDQLYRHNRTHNKPFKCDYCDYQTINKRDVLKHKSIQHKGMEKLLNKCNECSYETIHRSDLKKHLLVHKPPEEITMLKCPECSYETLYKSNLNSHNIRLHKKDCETFECYECGYQTRLKYVLKLHITKVHRKWELQDLDKCPQKFDVESSMAT